MLILPAVMPTTKPELEIRETSVAQFAALAGLLFEEHGEQVAGEGLDLGVLDINWSMFEALEQGEMLVSLGLWYGESIIGYVIALLTPDLLHNGRSQCQHVALYLQPEHRSSTVAKLLLDSAELIAEARGASEFYWSAPRGGKLERLLERRDDTDPVCTQFVRKLCPQQHQ